MDSGERQLFEASLRQAVERGGLFDAVLNDVGWRDAVAEDPTVAASVFALQGELNLTSAALDDVVAVGLGVVPSAALAVALPAPGAAVPPAAGDGRTVAVSGLGTSRMLTAAEVFVVVQRDRMKALRVTADELDRRRISGLDSPGSWVEVSGSVEAVDVSDVDWDGGIAAARRAIAQELSAASRAMLRLARDHALVREQFGKPIGAFQAVRHRLADCLLAVESADATIAVAWADPSPFAATMAKAVAGRSAATVARNAQQVLAGIGFTAEHPFHRYLKRTMVLDQLFGTSASLTEAIGSDVLRSGKVPAVLPL